MSELDSKLLRQEAQNKARKIEVGMVGQFLGNATEKPGNIAGIAIVLSFAMLVLLMYAPTVNDVPKRELYTLFGGIITSAFGFLFGRTTSDN